MDKHLCEEIDDVMEKVLLFFSFKKNRNVKVICFFLLSEISSCLIIKNYVFKLSIIKQKNH